MPAMTNDPQNHDWNLIPPGDQTISADRKYKVTKSAGHWTIARQPN